MFLSNLLLVKGQKGWALAHQLLIDLFLFLEPHLRKTELTDAMKHLYKGTLRVLLVLLHDYPAFLAGYHLSFCNVIPENCVQLRNLVLSAFPRDMRLPDPFTPNLKIDLLPEISKSPVILSDVSGPIATLRNELDSYLKNRQPTDFVNNLLPRLLKTNSKEIDAPRVNALVLYVGVQAINRLQNSQTSHALAHSPEMEVLQKLMELNDRGSYIALNAIANQLRYPSSHTHYYSCVMLYLFSEATDEGIKEQITRVLLERLIVQRPHPVRLCTICSPHFLFLSILTLNYFSLLCGFLLIYSGDCLSLSLNSSRTNVTNFGAILLLVVPLRSKRFLKVWQDLVCHQVLNVQLQLVEQMYHSKFGIKVW